MPRQAASGSAVPRRTPPRGVTALVLAVALAVLGLASPSYAGDGDPTTCMGHSVTIAGSSTGDRTMLGTTAADVLAAYSGDDVAFADGLLPTTGATDLLCLGAGDDLGDGGVGSDVLGGGNGDDGLFGGYTPVPGVPDDDRLIGGPGGDLLVGGLGDDRLEGGPGNDVVDVAISGSAAAGADRIRGGDGNDVIYGADDGATDDIDAGPGVDLCFVSPTDVVKNCETVFGQ